jgi:NADPH-dependent glutamate synthase beta subunit-like oxidoreductase
VDTRPRLLTPPDLLTTSERAGLVARAIGVLEGDIEQLIVDDDRLRGVQMDDGFVVTEATGRTSVRGVWAAGNLVDPRAQVITAAGAASASAIALNADPVEDDVRDALHAFNRVSHPDFTS